MTDTQLAGISVRFSKYVPVGAVYLVRPPKMDLGIGRWQKYQLMPMSSEPLLLARDQQTVDRFISGLNFHDLWEDYMAGRVSSGDKRLKQWMADGLPNKALWLCEDCVSDRAGNI